VRLDDVGEFVAWLRLPLPAPDRRVAVLPSVEHHRTESTVNRKLSAVGAFYTHAARDGVDVGELLVTWQRGGSRGGWRPFLHHISKSGPRPRRTIGLKKPNKRPRVLSPTEVQAILDACDRLLFAALYDTGMRISEALGLRHNDNAAAEREVTVRRRDDGNGARAKSATSRTIPVSAELIRLYADYLHDEYGDLDSDYVFVNLRGHPCGHRQVI
jgi:integrase/recombinase XerD